MITELDLPPNSKITCQDIQFGKDVQIGPDVQIECERLRLGNGVRIGCETDSDFRAVAGVRIQARELELGKNTIIGRCVRIRGGHIRLDREVRIKDWNDIYVKGYLCLGAGGVVHENCDISGRKIQFGRRLWMLPYTRIGGGSAFEVQSSLKAGHYVHLGVRCFINTARSVTIGDEVGLGTHTALYTHGAYPSELRGAPVAFAEIRIGDRTWIPGAVVNPGVTIGRDCVVGVGSVVTRDIPDGALAVGAPCKVIRENAYPRELSSEERHEKMGNFLRDFALVCSDLSNTHFDEAGWEVRLDDTVSIVYCEKPVDSTLAHLRMHSAPRLILLSYDEFQGLARDQETFIDLKHRTIAGMACSTSERLLNQLRRYGTRFYYESVDNCYQRWDPE
jgi:acetyltransferase-like isoleucine patch superfamily enzyme